MGCDFLVRQGLIGEAASGVSRGTRQHVSSSMGYKPAIIVIMKAAGKLLVVGPQSHLRFNVRGFR